MLLENKAVTTDQHVRYVQVTLLADWHGHPAGTVLDVPAAAALSLASQGLA